MTTPHALRDLATLIENLDEADLSIDGVRTPEGSLVDGRTLAAELTVRLDWGALDDVGSAVSVGLPDGTEVDSDESGVAFPLDVELDVGDAAAKPGSVAETAKTQVTDGGVAVPHASDGETARPDEVEQDGSDEAEDGSDERATEEPGGDDEAARDEEPNEADAELDEQTDGAEEAGTSEVAETSDAERRSEDPEAEAAPEPHRDPERLREAYESCETFPEMAEALGATVTPQTVRYHAIELGIHRPNERPSSTGRPDAESAGDDSAAADGRSDEGASESDGEPSGSGSEEGSSGSGTGERSSAPETESRAGALESEDGTVAERDESAAPDRYTGASPESARAEADGEREQSDGEEPRPSELQTEDLPADLDLPSHVALADLRDAVQASTTLYEVQRDLRVDRSAARRLLRDLNLLDLVTGRAATADERGASAATIDERIRRACA